MATQSACIQTVLSGIAAGLNLQDKGPDGGNNKMIYFAPTLFGANQYCRPSVCNVIPGTNAVNPPKHRNNKRKMWKNTFYVGVSPTQDLDLFEN